MQAYRIHLVIQDPESVTVSNLPFRPGQHVEVLFLVRDEKYTAAVQQFEALLQETRSLPQVQALTEEEIAAEVAAYRSGR